MQDAEWLSLSQYTVKEIFVFILEDQAFYLRTFDKFCFIEK